jgi:CheY-like chemotaxis protein
LRTGPSGIARHWLSRHYDDTTTRTLQLAGSERFDALLLDYWMPDLTGIELCRRIRGFYQNIPILICSGAARINRRTLCRVLLKNVHCIRPASDDQQQ